MRVTGEYAAALIHQIDDLEHSRKHINEELHKRQIDLDRVQAKCHHSWAEAKRHVKRTEGYFIPAEGHGSDFTSSVTVGPKEDVWYTRTCKNCGKEEKTSKTKTTATGPDFA